MKRRRRPEDEPRGRGWSAAELVPLLSVLHPGGYAYLQFKHPQSQAALCYAAYSSTPATAGPCGILVPGLGEILIGPPALVQLTAAVSFLGWYSLLVGIPDTTALIGETFYAQGIFVDATTPAEPFRLTGQLAEIHIGP